jgi:hypothetical protein
LQKKKKIKKAKVPLLQSTQNRKRLEHEWRKHQYHKTHKALED